MCIYTMCEFSPIERLVEPFRRGGGHCLKPWQPLRPMDAYPAGKAFTTLEALVRAGGEAWVMVLPQVRGKKLLLLEVFVAG